jgi:hypothetical protein
MPLPAHDMLTFSGVHGTVTDPIETWSFGVKLQPGPQAATPEAVAALGRTAYEQRYLAVMHPRTILTRVRFSRHNEGGLVSRQADGGYIQGDSDGALPGTGVSSNLLPLQTALVVSLITARPGARGKGRYFLPMPAMNLGDDYRISEFGQTQMANASQAFLTQIRGEIAAPIVASSYGFSSVVLECRVGRVVDTQRSRRRDLDEAYLSRPVAF